MVIKLNLIFTCNNYNETLELSALAITIKIAAFYSCAHSRRFHVDGSIKY